MFGRRFFNVVILIVMAVSLMFGGADPALAQKTNPGKGGDPNPNKKDRITQADREAAAARAAEAGLALPEIGMAEMSMPGEAPHYFSVPNYANSPLPGNAVVEWNAIAQEIVQPAGMAMPMMSSVSMSEAFVFLSYVHAAIYDALVAIEGGYLPYNTALAPADPNASRDAAIAAAAYTVLNQFFPSAMLDQHYASSLKAVTDGPEKDAGIAAGQAAGQGILALRANDGRGAEGTYIIPAPAPGVWQPTMMLPDGTMAPPIDPWMAVMQPFMLQSPSQFRPAPPPALESAEYAAQFNEVKELGSAMSMTRTPEQTEVANFWAANGVIQYNTAYREVALTRGMGLLDTARLLAMGNMVGSDTLTACFDAKYTFSFWRPVTAIRMADLDGNDATAADPNWMPLLMTPNHPEYTAGHACFASAQAEVFTQALGTPQIELDLTSDITGAVRHYATADDLRAEIIDARLWAGLHFRPSSELGVTLGQNVAQFSLANFFLPAESRAEHVMISGGIRKFVDGLPGLDAAAANNLGQYIPTAVADVNSFPGADYYEIGLVQYREKMHSDLPPTLLRGYVQLSTAEVPGLQVQLYNEMQDGTSVPVTYNGQPVYAVDNPHYMGPLIQSVKDRPVRIKFYNLLPTGAEGDLFIPVDTSVMGSGMGPLMADMTQMDPQNPMCGMEPKPIECYTENRATLHLHGGITPWISDGTAHQWITPANENTPYPQGVSVMPVPDMVDDGSQTDGAMTFYYTNQQSARLMFYHDHSYGITRLNVYAGEAAGYMITDEMEQALLSGGLIPADQLPLIVQDKTFVPSMTQLAATDPLWDMNRWGGYGDLWLPHVYVPAQNPGDPSGVNQFGRWAYGPWFWPPTTSVDYGPIPNAYYDPACDPDLQWCEPALMPGVPFNSMGMEAFMDTPVVNGTAYPTITIEPKSYRFRVLNAANDRFFNFSLYQAIDANGVLCDASNPAPAPEGTGVACTEVMLNPDEVAAALDDPAVIFPTPIQTTAGPSWIQIGTEGGFLPSPVVIPPQPITWVSDPTVFNAGNVDKHSLLLGPAERADVIVDFSQYAGQTLILYNDAPAAFPARDPRYDYYTGSADLVDTGGVPTIVAGYGPNTRTVMQIKVAASPAAPAFNLPALENAFLASSLGGLGVFENSQKPIIVGQNEYNNAYAADFKTNDGLVQIYDNTLTFKTIGGLTLTMPLTPKMIQDEMGEAFEHEYGRMSGNLGVETANAQAGLQNMILYAYSSPPSEVVRGIEVPADVAVTPIGTTDDGTQLWKITHNGVDTHPIHWHLYDVQLINRVGWDGIIRKPDLNELGWKDTVRISPLEDTIVAVRPIIPHLPFDLPNSVRLLDPTRPEGAYLANSSAQDAAGLPIFAFAPNGEPIDIINHYVNFGWEYMFHCHILSHEEMDMMRPVVVGVTPRAPTNLAYTMQGSSVNLTWTDNSINETAFILQRAGDSAFTTGLVTYELAPNVTSYTDSTTKNNQTYFFRVIARNVVGDTWDYSDPALNEGASFPTETMDSAPSNTVMKGNLPTAPLAPTTLAAALQNGPQISLTWRDNSNNESGFIIERMESGGTYAVLTTTAANIVSFIDPTVMPGVTYTYRVAAANAGGQSAYTNEATVSVPSLPAAPSGLTGTATALKRKGAQVALRWVDNATNETGFTIQRATNLSFTAGVTSYSVPANTTTYTVGSLTNRTTFYFRIRANNQSGSSTWSNIYIVTTP